MNDLPLPSDVAWRDPLLVDRHWRSALLWTLRDLQHSVERRRTLSLPNLCRLFERRWREVEPSPEQLGRGSALGREFLRAYYLACQSFTAGRIYVCPIRRGRTNC